MAERKAIDGPVAIRHFSASLPMMLLRAREAVMGRFRAMLREHGTTEQQWRVLRALDAGGRQDVTQIAGATFLLAPSLTRILRDLGARGLLAAAADPGDNRRKLVELSAEGRALIETIAPFSERIYGELTASIGSERLEALQTLLQDVQDRVGGSDAENPSLDSSRPFA